MISGSAPLTAVQLLWVNMIMDTLGALALATEPPNDELMKKAPVGRTGNFISNVMWRNILGQSIYQLMVIWFLQAYGKTYFELENHPNSDLALNTIIFNTFVFCQVGENHLKSWPLQLCFYLSFFGLMLALCAALQRGELKGDGEDQRASRDSEQPRVRLSPRIHSPVPDHNR